MTIANIAAAAIRFGILRTWVFRPEFGTRLTDVAGPTGEGTHRNRSREMTRTPS